MAAYSLLKLIKQPDEGAMEQESMSLSGVAYFSKTMMTLPASSSSLISSSFLPLLAKMNSFPRVSMMY